MVLEGMTALIAGQAEIQVPEQFRESTREPAVRLARLYGVLPENMRTNVATNLTIALRVLGLTGELLSRGHSEDARNILTNEVQRLRQTAGALRADSDDRRLLEGVALSLDASAAALRAGNVPDSVAALSGLRSSLRGLGTLVVQQAEAGQDDRARLLEEIALVNFRQAVTLTSAIRNTKTQLGLDTSQFMRQWVLRGQNLGADDRTRINRAFDQLDQLIRNRGLLFHEAVNANDLGGAIALGGRVPPEANAAILEINRYGLQMYGAFLSLSQAVARGDADMADRALSSIYAEARREGREQLVDTIIKEVGAIALASLVSWGIGGLARLGTAALRFGPRIIRGVQIGTELATFVPAHRVIGGRGLGGTSEEWGTEYALAIGGYALFRALGRAIRFARSALRRTPRTTESPIFASGTDIPETLRRPFTGDLAALERELLVLDPSFGGIRYGPVDGLGRYDPATNSIILNEIYRGRGIPRGVLAEEVRHFLDKVEFGINSEAGVRAAWFRDRGLRPPADLTQRLPAVQETMVDRWHHRRVFTRLIRDLDPTFGSPNGGIIRRILDPRDLDGLLEAYANLAGGRLNIAQLIDFLDTFTHAMGPV